MHKTSVLLLALACTPDPTSTTAPPPPAFQLDVGNLVAGQSNTIAVQGAPPLSNVVIGFSTVGIGDGPCPVLVAPECLDLLDPVYLAPVQMVTDAQGQASTTAFLRAPLADSYIAMQAAVLASGTLSNAVGRAVLPVGTQLPSDADVDGDGFSIDDGDCNDADPAVNPWAIDVLADGVDNDCDGLDDGTPFVDMDGDGFDPLGGDCDDDDPTVNPAALEVCNGLDDDCNGATDEGENTLGCRRYYNDDDGDGYAGAPGVCTCGPTPTHSSDFQGDCNDADPNVYPFQTETFSVPRANGTYDYNCDGADRPRWPEDGDCGCPDSFLAPTPFVEGWVGDPPACGEYGEILLECSYTLNFTIPNPLYPLIGPPTLTECLQTDPSVTELRVQECG